jgi:APA family basic amino acid/polyamine antiporter
MKVRITAAPSRELVRRLGLLDLTSIVIGTMIGSAIFLVPSTIAQNVHSGPVILAMWLLAGVASMLGGLAYAELGAMMPESGGQYVYLREAWGPLWGFLCGWTFFLVARSGATAAVASGFATYLSQLIPMPAAVSRMLAAALILVLALVNCRGLKLGVAVQNVFTVLKLLGLLLLAGSAFLGSSLAPAQPAASSPDWSAAQLGAALVACIFAYNGWFVVGMVGGEVKDPQRNLPRATILGVTAVTLIYFLVNLSYFRTLSIGEIASAGRVADAAATRSMGAAGSSLIALTILASTLGTTNSTILTASRLYFAQARDGLFFKQFGNVHPAFETPHISLVGSGIWSAILAVSGSYAQLVSYATFIFWILYGVTVAGLIVLRRTRPEAPRPYRMSGYPVTPVLFIGVAGWVAVSAFLSAPMTSAAGVLILVAGVPAFYLWRRFARSSD